VSVTDGDGNDTVISSASDGVITVLTDDNRLPNTSSKYKIRMVHGASSLRSDTLNLAVNLSTVASNQAYLGASSYSSRTYATTATVTVIDNASGSAIYDKTDLSLEPRYVYSMYIYDTATGAASGNLVAERTDG
jgi:hypothetical protein